MQLTTCLEACAGCHTCSWRMQMQEAQPGCAHMLLAHADAGSATRLCTRHSCGRSLRSASQIAQSWQTDNMELDLEVLCLLS